jgi:RimJ/RimL family protein N-acetyltransferase
VRISPIIVRIRTPRLTLRVWRPADAQVLADAVMLDGGEHLRRWMAWVKNEPESLEARRRNLWRLRRRALAGMDMAFGIFPHDESEVIGAVGMHPRIGCGAGEIGYWIRGDRIRNGFAREAAGAVARMGFEALGLRRMEIHTDPANLASVGVARSLGFEHQVVVRACVLSADSPVRDDSILAMQRVQYPGSSASSGEVSAFDHRGRRVPLVDKAI